MTKRIGLPPTVTHVFNAQGGALDISAQVF